jgi:hypothetical protein
LTKFAENGNYRGMIAPLTRAILLVPVLLAAAFSAQAQSVSAASGVATLTLDPLSPFTVTCQVTDIPAGYKVLYPDARQSALADGRQNLPYKTVAGEAFTVERRIEEPGQLVRITDSFPDEAASLQLAKTLIMEFKGIDVADAVLEFTDGNRADAGGQTCSAMAENFKKWGAVTCTGLSLAYPSGEKLVISFDEPRKVSANAPGGDGRDLYSFRLGYPDGPSKSTFEFRVEGKAEGKGKKK